MTHPLRCSFIGLGAMGAPMARHLAARGLLVALWNRTRERASALAAELGVAAPESLADVAACSDLVFVCVSADADVRAVVAGLKPGLRAGGIVVDTSTVAMQTATDLAAELASIGVDFLDAPLTGGVEGARNGRLSVMVGGDAAVLERARPAFEAFAARLVRMGGVGAGQATKAVNQVMIGGIAEAVCEALAFGEALGLPRAELLAVLTAGAANSWFLEKRGQSMLEGRYDVGFKLALLHKDLGIVQQMAAALGTRLPTVDAAHRDYSTLMAEGRGEDEISSLIRVKRRLFEEARKGKA
ncbi:MAG: NAD(P)-dependent oxidoreductase [Xanthomonadales bacterium]|nr:NAD(P)-dependent oxidoreductase [Xanthomonadales bacterium]MCE7930138.1 NAD(P)-dependent oxidoreductase [Xanthomonadales bacterium PRO6]